MTSKKQTSSTSRIESIRYAIHGVQKFFREEPNARIHLLATGIVCVAALYLRVSKTELLLLIMVMGLVWISEIFNTAIENIMDFVSTGRDERIKAIKDLSAAAVLVSVIIAVATGLLVFIPKLF